jgi:hypothetical protein
VESLFTKIPLDSLLSLLNHHLPSVCSSPEESSSILSFLHSIITNNTFFGGGHFYLQKIGLAMGACMSSSLANIYLGLLESQICQQLLPPVLIYKRYMDDIFILFDNENNSLNTFLSFLQCHNPSCHFHKFTRQIQNKILSATISPEEDCVSFTLLIQNSSKSSTKIHVKIIHISPSVSKCQ